MSDNEDYDDVGKGKTQTAQRARFDVFNHYHDVTDGARISHVAVQNDVFCIVGSGTGGGGASGGCELYIRDTAADSLKRMPLPCAVSGLFQSLSGAHVFVTSTAGDLFYVNARTMTKPNRVIAGGPGQPVILDVAVLDASTAPKAAAAASSGSEVKVLLGYKNGTIGYLAFAGDANAKAPAATTVQIQCQSLGKSQLAVTSIEAILSSKGGGASAVIVLATTPVGLYSFTGPDAVSATQQPPVEVCRVNSNMTTFDPSYGRPLHIVRSFSDSAPTAFVWTTSSAVVHGCFQRERSGKIALHQTVNFPFTKDIRMRATNAPGVGANGDRAPLQVVTTAFHMFLRYENRIAVLRVPPGLPWRPRIDPAAAEARRIMEKTSKLSETFAEFDWNDRHVFNFDRKQIKILGVVRDVENRRTYAFSDTLIWNIAVANERVDVWRLFFERAVDKDERWEHRVRFFFAAAQLSPKNSRERDQVWFRLGRSAYGLSKPGKLLGGLAEDLTSGGGGGGKGGYVDPASTRGGGGGWGASGSSAGSSSPASAVSPTGSNSGVASDAKSDLEDLAVDAFSRCTMFDEIVLLVRGSATLLPKFIERRLQVLTEPGATAGPQQLALLVTFALLLRLKPRMEAESAWSAVANKGGGAAVSSGGNNNKSQPDAVSRALDKLVSDLKSKPKLMQLLNDNYFYGVVTRLLESLGHLDKSTDLAIATGRFRNAVSHHCQMREYSQAAAVLVEHCCAKQEAVDLWYDFAGQVVALCRDDVFRGFRKIAKAEGIDIDYRRFIPAFIAYDESRKADPDVHEHKVVSLLSLVIMQNKGQHAAVGGNGLPRVLNDLFLSILFLQLKQARAEKAQRKLRVRAGADSDEDVDMTEIIDGQIDEVLGTEYDESAIDSLPDISLEYSLRRCVELGHTELSIRLYRLLKMPQQALTASLRLPNGLERAQSLLEELKQDRSHSEAFMKSLWMLLAQLVLTDNGKGVERDSTNDTKIVLGLIARSQGILRLEEVIVLLQAQEALQDFRLAVCDALNSYTEKIKALTDEMSQATKLAEHLRSDLDGLDHQFGYVTAAQRCNACKTALLKAKHEPFVVFPTCRHAFHYQCGKAMFDRREELMKKVARACEIEPRSKDGVPLWQRLFEAECPHCGEWAIQRITAPLGGDDM